VHVAYSQTERAFYDTLRKDYVQALNALLRANRAQSVGNPARNTQLAGKALAALTVGWGWGTVPAAVPACVTGPVCMLEKTATLPLQLCRTDATYIWFPNCK
jgi:hypothetical protein